MNDNNTTEEEELITINVYDIEWDTENEEQLCDLPVDILDLDMPKDMNLDEELAQVIADVYEVGVKNLNYEILDK